MILVLLALLALPPLVSYDQIAATALTPFVALT